MSDLTKHALNEASLRRLCILRFGNTASVPTVAQTIAAGSKTLIDAFDPEESSQESYKEFIRGTTLILSIFRDAVSEFNPAVTSALDEGDPHDIGRVFIRMLSDFELTASAVISSHIQAYDSLFPDVNDEPAS